MNSTPIPDMEAERLADLYEYDILDSAPEQDFTDIVELASYICKVPISHISFIERQRSWHKAHIGLGENETPRHLSFCSHTISGQSPMIVGDASKDDRFAANPYVLGDPGIRFYAGFPLVTSNGNSIGTLCVVDTIPRTMDEEQLRALDILAKQVMKLLDERVRSQKFQQRALHEEQRNQRLQQMIATQRRIMAILGHDTRGPLFYINWIIKSMMDGKLNPAELQGNFHVITNQLDSTLIMIEDLLDWSRVNILNAGGDREMFAVKEVVDEIIAPLQNIANNKSILLVNDVPEEMLGLCYERIVRFALRNLLVNAIKFTKQGTVQVKAVAHRQWIRFSVTDTGIGMTEQQVDKILKAESSSTIGTANERGAGLGIILIHEFLQQVNGKLDVESTPGAGTTVSITLQAGH